MQLRRPTQTINTLGVFSHAPLFRASALPPAAYLFLTTLIFIFAAQPDARCAQKKTQKPPASDSIVMTSASATYSIDDESFSMPGPVNIELQDAAIAGRDLSYNNKTGLGSLHGDPVTVNYTRGGNSTLTAPDLSFDSKNQTAKLSGGVSATHSTGTVSAQFHAGIVDFDFRLSTLEASGKVTMTLSDSAARTSAPAPTSADMKKKPLFDFATTPAVFTADYIRYNMKTGEAQTGDNPTASLPDAFLSSRGPIKASLKSKTVTADSGIVLRAGKDITASAGKVSINYADSQAILSGGVTGSRGSDSFSAGAVRVEYPKTGSVIYFTGGVQINFSAQNNLRDKTEPGLRTGPCPGGDGVFKPQPRNCEALEP